MEIWFGDQRVAVTGGFLCTCGGRYRHNSTVKIVPCKKRGSLDLVGVGDRVSRATRLDDGTWARLGDKCLERSPRAHGEVREIKLDPDSRYPDILYGVKFDGTESLVWYFRAGIDLEKRAVK